MKKTTNMYMEKPDNNMVIIEIDDPNERAEKLEHEALEEFGWIQND